MRAGTLRPMEALPVDISAGGIGILTTEPVKLGTQAVLILPNNQRIVFEARYCEKSLSRPGYYRLGLEVVDGGPALEDVYPHPEGIKLGLE